MITRTISMEITHREAGIMLFLLAGMLGKLRCAPAYSKRERRKLQRAIGQHKMLWRRIRAHRQRIS